MTVEITDEDRGKTLVSRNKRLGVVTDVRGNHVYLDIDWDNFPDKLAEELDVEPGEEHHRVDESVFEASRNDEVVIRDDIWPR